LLKLLKAARLLTFHGFHQLQYLLPFILIQSLAEIGKDDVFTFASRLADQPFQYGDAWQNDVLLA
jgi:hypothetical protein